MNHFKDTDANTISELQTLIKTANTAYTAFYAAMLNAPQTPEVERLRSINDTLRQAIVTAKNHINSL